MRRTTALKPAQDDHAAPGLLAQPVWPVCKPCQDEGALKKSTPCPISSSSRSFSTKKGKGNPNPLSFQCTSENRFVTFRLVARLAYFPPLFAYRSFSLFAIQRLAASPCMCRMGDFRTMDMTGLMVLLSEHLLRHVTLLSIRPPPAAGSTWQAANVQHLTATHHEREDVPVTYHMILQNQQLSSHLRDEGSYCVIVLEIMYLSAAGSNVSMGQWPMRKFVAPRSRSFLRGLYFYG